MTPVPNEFEQRPRQDTWVTRWLKSESFWQGIVIQTLGTLGAAVIIALVAIFSGVGYTPAIRYFVVFGLTMISILALAAFAGYLFSNWIDRKVESSRWWRRHAPGWLHVHFTLGVIVGSISVFILYILEPLIRDTIASWTGYTP